VIKFLVSLFTRSREVPAVEEPAETEPARDFGFIDYDGMGNQGRFPTGKDKKRGR
jgi:hypothetical protein